MAHLTKDGNHFFINHNIKEGTALTHETFNVTSALKSYEYPPTIGVVQCKIVSSTTTYIEQGTPTTSVGMCSLGVTYGKGF